MASDLHKESYPIAVVRDSHPEGYSNQVLGQQLNVGVGTVPEEGESPDHLASNVHENGVHTYNWANMRKCMIQTQHTCRNIDISD